MNTTTTEYFGIEACNESSFQAILKHTFWIGYIESNKSEMFGHQDILYSSLCPRRYCTKGMHHHPVHFPETADIEELDSLVCGPTRTGSVCGQCRENHSAFYHSENLDCYPNHYLQLGLAVLYSFRAIASNNSFYPRYLIQYSTDIWKYSRLHLFFAQLFDTLLVTAHGQIVLESKTYYTLLSLRFIYRMFNLDFFTTSKLSFCLWKDASSLDILVMKYVTIAYSLLLILLVMFILNKCS